ncbi:MAG: XRE family transcriptional regulator [Candidatus Limnocylindrales bacterium]
MDDQRVGSALRAVRLRRRWRQLDVAQRAGVSRSLVSLMERGHLDRLSLRALRSVGAVLDIRVDVIARWRGGELDRLLNVRHSAMHERLARALSSIGGWELAPEVSFNVYGERGVIDLLAWHAGSGSLLVVEIKTEVVDVQELIGTMSRKTRLAPRVAGERGWPVDMVSRWIVVADSSMNRRRIAAHKTVLGTAFPADGRTMRRWLRTPDRAIAALSMWSDANPGGTKTGLAPTRRVGRPRTHVG